MGIQRASEDGTLALRDALGHQQRFADCRRAVVDRCIGCVHAQQLAGQRLKLEHGLQRALADLGLVGRVGGVELGQAHDVADRGRRVVVVSPAADEARPVPDRHILPGDVRQVAACLHLRQGWRQVERWKAEIRRHVSEQIFYCRGADGAQHLLAVGRRQLGECGH